MDSEVRPWVRLDCDRPIVALDPDTPPPRRVTAGQRIGGGLNKIRLGQQIHGGFTLCEVSQTNGTGMVEGDQFVRGGVEQCAPPGTYGVDHREVAMSGIQDER